jgi:hypothetical protein
MFLLWHRQANRQSVSDVCQKLQKLFFPVFNTELKTQILEDPMFSLVFLHLPVKGWKPPFFEDDHQTWAAAVDYPLNIHSTVRDQGKQFEQPILPVLARALEKDPVPFLKSLAPPFSLIWRSKERSEFFVANDGLGQSQLFEYNNGHCWALTNKIAAFSALDLPLVPLPGEWAVRSTLGWFPLNMTGFKHIQFVGPATQFRLNAEGIHKTNFEILDEWLKDHNLSSEECLELARESLLHQIRSVQPHWEKPSVGLSGGWDSRAVVSSLLYLNVDFAARVRGLPERVDVEVAKNLAQIAGFPLKHNATGGLPPDDLDMCRRSILLSLRWQAGYMVTHKHKSFLAEKPYLDGGRVNVMGQHGEIGRGYYYKTIKGSRLTGEQYEENLLKKLLQNTPPFIRKEHHNFISDVIRESYHQADGYDLSDVSRLDFFYLYERTRRWASGSLSSQTGLVFAPFLNPDYIRAVFAYEVSPKQDNPFHTYIITRNAPQWINVPFARDLKTGESPADATTWKIPLRHASYDSNLYWQTVGKRLITETLSEEGIWTEVFDPNLTREQWQVAPDALMMLSLLPQAIPNFYSPLKVDQ